MASTSQQVQSLEDVFNFLRRRGITIKTPSDPDWNTYKSTFNLRLPVTPALVVIPTTKQHVREAVLCAAKHELRVQAKSGGHSYASFSNGGSDGAVVVNLEKFQDVDLDVSTGVVRVGGGVRLGNLASAIYIQGGRTLSHGTCAGVGIGGHFTHGGYGFSSRAWGLAMDQIVALDVVMADGKYVHATESDNSDLYWAMRGAADSFGIIVNFYLQTQPAPSKVVNWSVDISDAAKSVTSAVEAFLRIQNFAQDASKINRNLGFGVSIGPKRISVSGTYLGSLEMFNSIIIPAMKSGIPDKATVSTQEVDWLGSLRLLNGSNDLKTSRAYDAHYDEHSNFLAKSVTVPAPGMTKEALTSYFDYIFTKGAEAPVKFFVLVDLYGGADSQINKKRFEYSAFGHRDALWVAQHYGYVDNEAEFPAEGIAFMDGLNKAMTEHLPRWGAYDNYADPTLTKEEAHKLYYGEEICKKLGVLKKKYDPGNVFAHPQSI